MNLTQPIFLVAYYHEENNQDSRTIPSSHDISFAGPSLRVYIFEIEINLTVKIVCEKQNDIYE